MILMHRDDNARPGSSRVGFVPTKKPALPNAPSCSASLSIEARSTAVVRSGRCCDRPHNEPSTAVCCLGHQRPTAKILDRGSLRSDRPQVLSQVGYLRIRERLPDQSPPVSCVPNVATTESCALHLHLNTIYAVPQKASRIPRTRHRLGLTAIVRRSREDGVCAWLSRGPAKLPLPPSVWSIITDEP